MFKYKKAEKFQINIWDIVLFEQNLKDFHARAISRWIERPPNRKEIFNIIVEKQSSNFSLKWRPSILHNKQMRS